MGEGGGLIPLYGLCLSVTDPLIISFSFIILSCREKADDMKEFSRENSKPRRESRMTIH